MEEDISENEIEEIGRPTKRRRELQTERDSHSESWEHQTE
jgi:hypothetical protein